MSTHLLHHGQHRRLGTLAYHVDDVRRFLARVLPEPYEVDIEAGRATPVGESWHAVWCALGDVAEDVFAWLAVGLAVLACAVFVALAWLLLPVEFLMLLAAVGVVTALIVWRVRVAARIAALILAEELGEDEQAVRHG